MLKLQYKAVENGATSQESVPTWHLPVHTYSSVNSHTCTGQKILICYKNLNNPIYAFSPTHTHIHTKKP